MRRNLGKMTMSSVLMTIILVGGGFFLFKFIKTSVTKKTIENKIYDSIGERRGNITQEEIVEMIRNILSENGVDPEIAVIDVKAMASHITYTVQYTIVTDYILSKKKETVSIANGMETSGL